MILGRAWRKHFTAFVLTIEYFAITSDELSIVLDIGYAIRHANRKLRQAGDYRFVVLSDGGSEPSQKASIVALP